MRHSVSCDYAVAQCSDTALSLRNRLLSRVVRARNISELLLFSPQLFLYRLRPLTSFQFHHCSTFVVPDKRIHLYLTSTRITADIHHEQLERAFGHALFNIFSYS
jgi:hypothetical protein